MVLMGPAEPLKVPLTLGVEECRMSRKPFYIFREKLLDDLLESWVEGIREEIAKLSDEYILTVGESSYVQHLVHVGASL